MVDTSDLDKNFALIELRNRRKLIKAKLNERTHSGSHKYICKHRDDLFDELKVIEIKLMLLGVSK